MIGASDVGIRQRKLLRLNRKLGLLLRVPSDFSYVILTELTERAGTVTGSDIGGSAASLGAKLCVTGSMSVTERSFSMREAPTVLVAPIARLAASRLASPASVCAA